MFCFQKTVLIATLAHILIIAAMDVVLINKILHLCGVFLVLYPLGGVALHIMNGGTRNYRYRRLVAITHGIGMLLTIVSGLELARRLGWPAFMHAKLLIWLVMGLLLGILYRMPGQVKFLWWMVPLIAVGAAYLGLAKPF